MGPSPICATGGGAGGKETAAAPGAQRPAESAEAAFCDPWPRVVTRTRGLAVGQRRGVLRRRNGAPARHT
eukprot:11199244-Lingulodinium_polyedra.AAC.1